MERKGWILVKLLMLITGVLIFVYLITPKLQKDVFRARDLMTQTNLFYIRATLLKYYRDNGRWSNSLTELIPKYLDKIPKEYLSSIQGSNKVINASNDNHFNSLRAPGLEGWIYGAYDFSKGEQFSYKVLPMCSTLSDKSGDTSSW